jgi:uracil phosphoribosyltransferase
MDNLHQFDHPLVRHHMVRLRDQRTRPEEFRAIVRRLTTLLAYEATRNLETKPTRVETPLGVAEGHRLQQRIGLVPILRAGLAMVGPVLELIPDAEVWHLGFYRDEKTFKPVEYYSKLPEARPVDVALVVDPMLATGGSAVAALDAIRKWGTAKAKLLSIIAAPEGIEKVFEAHADTEIYVCGVDSHLDEHAYIVPGLGDAGDRIFNARVE